MPKPYDISGRGSDARALQAWLGATVRAHRLRLGVTQEELAWRADIHRTYVADIERGSRNLTLRTIENLARALRVPVESLLTMGGAATAPVAGGNALREILLVEDNAADVALTLRTFKRANLKNPVKVANDGEDALDYLFRAGPYAGLNVELPLLVLLDLNLPKMSGVDVLRRLKANPATRSIPVVVLTVSRQDRLILECSRLGAANYIIKPVGFDNLSQATPALNMNWILVGPAKAGTGAKLP